MIGLTEIRQQELIKWLEEEITAYESARDEIPFGLAADESNVLDSYSVALRFLNAMTFPQWIEWEGGNIVPINGFVEIKLRDGSTDTAYSQEWSWHHENAPDDIVAYRVVAI